MTQQEYEQKKRECWEEFKNTAFNGDISYSTYSALDFAFDYAYALVKQEKDAEETAISGWVAVDEDFLGCYLHINKPICKNVPIADTGDYQAEWRSEGQAYLLDDKLFPDMDSDSDPIEVELVIKRKNNE